MSELVTEQELAAKAVAPRVTKADIDALKERITYTTEQCPQLYSQNQPTVCARLRSKTK